MCTKILKKESSSRALAFFMLMFMMPLGFIGNTHSCGAMENDDEKKRLLGHTYASINGDARDVEQGREILTSVVVQSDDPLTEIRIYPFLLTKVKPLNLPIINVEAASLERRNPLDLPQVNIDSTSLKRPNPKLAQDEMNKIIHYLSYVSGDEELKIEVIKAAKLLEIYLDDAVLFQKRLYDRAMGAAGQGPLANYLKDLRSKIIGLQKIIPELQGQNVQLREQIGSLILGIQNLQVVVPQLQEQVDQLTRENSGLFKKFSDLQDIVPQLQEQNHILGDLLKRKGIESDSIRSQNERVETTQRNEIRDLKRKNLYLWVALPAASILTGVAAFFVSHYVWR